MLATSVTMLSHPSKPHHPRRVAVAQVSLLATQRTPVRLESLSESGPHEHPRGQSWQGMIAPAGLSVGSGSQCL